MNKEPVNMTDAELIEAKRWCDLNWSDPSTDRSWCMRVYGEYDYRQTGVVKKPFPIGIILVVVGLLVLLWLWRS